MSGSRQISPDFCEIIVFGGIQDRKIIAETALLIFRKFIILHRDLILYIKLNYVIYLCSYRCDCQHSLWF